MFGEGKYLIEGEGDERLLIHCSWCQPANNPKIKAEIEAYKSMFKIEKVSSGICKACAAIMNQELDDLDNQK